MGKIHKHNIPVGRTYLAVQRIRHHNRTFRYCADNFILIPVNDVSLQSKGLLPLCGAKHGYLVRAPLLPQTAPQGTCYDLFPNDKNLSAG